MGENDLSYALGVAVASFRLGGDRFEEAVRAKLKKPRWDDPDPAEPSDSAEPSPTARRASDPLMTGTSRRLG